MYMIQAKAIIFCIRCTVRALQEDRTYLVRCLAEKLKSDAMYSFPEGKWKEKILVTYLPAAIDKLTGTQC